MLLTNPAYYIKSTPCPLLVICVYCVWSVCLVVFCRIYDGGTDLWCAHRHRACRTIDFCYHPLQNIISHVRDLHISLTQSLLPYVLWCACVSIGNGSTFENYYIDIVHVTVFADLLHKNSIKLAILMHQGLTRQTLMHTET